MEGGGSGRAFGGGWSNGGFLRRSVEKFVGELVLGNVARGASFTRLCAPFARVSAHCARFKWMPGV